MSPIFVLVRSGVERAGEPSGVAVLDIYTSATLRSEVVYLNNSTYNPGLSVYEISRWDIIQDDMKSSQSEVMDLVGEVVHTG